MVGFGALGEFALGELGDDVVILDMPVVTVGITVADPAIFTGDSVLLPAASMTLTGYALEVRTAAIVDLPSVGIDVSPLSPTLPLFVGVTAPTTEIGINASAPAILAGVAVDMAGATISVAGPALAGVGPETAIQPAAFVVSVSAPEPLAAAGVFLPLPAATIGRDALAPIFLAGVSVGVPAAEVAVSAPLISVVATLARRYAIGIYY